MVWFYKIRRFVLMVISNLINHIIFFASGIIVGRGLRTCGIVTCLNYTGKGKIVLGNSVSINPLERLNENTNIKKEPVLIKKNAFIGAHCIILKGVTIGENAVVAAGAVVSRDIPDGEVWGGNPAHYIKKVI